MSVSASMILEDSLHETRLSAIYVVDSVGKTGITDNKQYFVVVFFISRINIYFNSRIQWGRIIMKK